MFETSNTKSQPLKNMAVFNNWDVLPEGWYCLGHVHELDEKNIFSVTVGKQELVVFRSKDGKIYCLDAFCSHLGLRLSTGDVIEDKLRCKFHHWTYSGEGDVFDSGCKKISDHKKQSTYITEVRYDLIWIWPGKNPAYPLPYHQDLKNDNFHHLIGKPYKRPSHHHISLLNALDIQHVNTVHALEMEVSGKHHVSPDQSYIHYDFEGKFLSESRAGKRNAKLTGGGYRFSVRYAGTTIGFLKALEGIKLFGKISFPPIYATFGYRQVNDGTIIQPVFLTPKRKGPFGKFRSWFHLKLTEFIYNKLKNEDGEIYENIRFTPNFTSDDQHITSFVAYVNRLPVSGF